MVKTIFSVLFFFFYSMEAFEFPDVLVSRKSPAGVYAQAQEYIEKELGKKCSAMESRYQKAKDMCASECVNKLVNQKGTRLVQENKAQEKMWLDFIKRKIEFENNKKSQTSGQDTNTDAKEARLAEQLKDTPLVPLTMDVLADEYVSSPFKTLVSMSAFQAGIEDWIQNASRSIKLSKKYELVHEAFGLPLELNGKDISKEYLTLDRLVRSFRGTFVISNGDHKERFDKCLVRVDSAFMENVILIKGVGSGKRIPVRSVYVTHKRAGQAIDTSSNNFNPEDIVVYLDFSIEFVLNALNETMDEVTGIYSESRDDVI